jgi:tetratricopeptide (TPR) repeat protein
MNSRLKIIIAIFFLAVAVRLIYLEQIKEAPLFSYPAADSGDYHKAGVKLAAGTMTEKARENFLKGAVYQNFLKVIYRVSEPDAYFASLAQILIGGASCCLIYLLGRSIFDGRVGMISGVLAGLYWPLAAFAAKTLPLNLAIFFSLLSALSLQKFYKKGNRMQAFIGGIFLALASLVRPNFLLLFPVIALWFLVCFIRRSGRSKSVLNSVVFIVGFISVMIPIGMVDYSARKEVILVQKNYAVTVYMGSNLELVNLRPGAVWRKKMMELLRADLTTRAERDLYWLERIKEVITENPTGYFKDFIRKIYILLNGYEFAPYESLSYFRERSTFLSLPFPGFGFIVPFAIGGMLLVKRRFREQALLLYLFAIIYFISLLPFPPLARYRLPITPFLIVFASYCILDFFDAFREKKWKYLSKCACLFLPVFLLTNINPMRADLENFSRPYYHEGGAYLKAGEPKKALVSLEKALAKHPDDADIYEALGDAFFRLDDLARAEASYKQALEIEPEFPEAMEKLGVVYGKKGELDKAIATFKKVLSLFPVEYASTHVNLATSYSLKGEKKKAQEELKRALELDPDNPRALYKLQQLQ